MKPTPRPDAHPLGRTAGERAPDLPGRGVRPRRAGIGPGARVLDGLSLGEPVDAVAGRLILMYVPDP